MSTEIKKQNERELVEVLDEIGVEIMQISNAMKCIERSVLKKEAVIILLKSRLPSIRKEDIKAVLEEAAGLSSSFLK